MTSNSACETRRGGEDGADMAERLRLGLVNHCTGVQTGPSKATWVPAGGLNPLFSHRQIRTTKRADLNRSAFLRSGY